MRLNTAAKALALFTSLGLAVPGAARADDDERGKHEVRVTNLRNDEGKVRAGIFESSRGFPLRVDEVARKVDAPIEDGAATLTFDDLPRGTYAVVVYHDENDNGKLDRNFIGKPKEGAGLYRPVRSRFPPPKFRDAKFDFRGDDKTIRVQLRYL